MNRSRLVVAAAVLIILAATGGCSLNESQGTVVGYYRLVGGPAPGVARPQFGTVWAYSGDVPLAGMLRRGQLEARGRTGRGTTT